MKTRYVIGLAAGAALLVGALENPAHSSELLTQRVENLGYISAALETCPELSYSSGTNDEFYVDVEAFMAIVPDSAVHYATGVLKFLEAKENSGADLTCALMPVLFPKAFK